MEKVQAQTPKIMRTKYLVRGYEGKIPRRPRDGGHMTAWACPKCHHTLWALAVEVAHRCPNNYQGRKLTGYIQVAR